MSKSGYPRKNQLSADNMLASPNELTALTANMRQNFIAELEKPPIDLHNPEQVKQAIIDYFIDCEEHGKRPANMGLYRALNLTRQDVNNVITGKSKSKLSPICIDMLKKALQLLAEYREQLGAQGKLNPVTLLFWQKNYDGLEDYNKLEISASHSNEASLSPDEIQKQIESDIPIDVPYKE